MPAEKHEHDDAAPQVDYDTFVNWDARLAREAPLFRRVFEDAGARRVIDVGAGSARHSIMFATWGLAVDAVDPDDSMLSQAENNIADAAQRIADAGGTLTLTRGGFGELALLGLGPADALVCTGNALPHVGSIEGLRNAFADFSAVLRTGAAVVLHLLNHGRLIAKRVTAIPPVVRETPEGTKVFLRILDYLPDESGIGFDFLTLTRDPGYEWELASRRSVHTALPPELLKRELEAAGFDRVELLGGHDGHALTDDDESVIVVARKAG